MQAVIILIIAVSAFAAPKCAQTNVANVVSDLNPKQPVGTNALAIEMYKKALLSEEVKIPTENRTEAIRDRLNRINNSTSVNKTQEVNEQIEKINVSIKTIEEESAKVNASIIESYKKINETQKTEKMELKAKMEEIAKEKALIDSLNKKKEELRKKSIEYYRLKITAEKIVEAQAEQMRNRRRFIRDLEESKKRVDETNEALEKVKQAEHNKRIEAIKKTKEYLNNLRGQDAAQEMKEREEKLRKDRVAEVIRRKINALRKYKLENQKKVEDLKQKVLDTKLKNKLDIEKNDYLTKIKAELADEIDELKKQKTAFETEKTIAEKKIANDMKIEKENLKAAQRAQIRKNFAYKNNRKDLAKLRSAVLKHEKEQLERDATKKILKSVIKSNNKKTALDKAANLDILMVKAETANKKKILQTISDGIKSTLETEKKALEGLKNLAVKSKEERQVFKTQIARDILVDAHNRHLAELKERKHEIEELVKDKIAKRNRKAALKLNKAQSKIALAGLQGKLDKKYILKRQEVALKNAKALSDAVKGLVPKKGDKFLKLKNFKVNCGSLAKKMSTPCQKK
ncbi:hypothetical protein ENU1_165960 [Entamoeba nuttalli P19]|uniref:DNA double-strand break repair Rad50 ATPase n=1 Tax=Entamoeba nuttalli (strain P19) TaxID=1076696 RepID=K2GXB2_ENTNP|nr:hypothetical protein ENU1_165960 [Entamoeba nuttalli P19]EKE38442.1 hypothetical protein ENU1_165960 [Entamoeba nuttalli P19]|eukprot:XP_008859223.1 hypothetical protein ENU1_165960 [Entamoeba nuttalli P19]